jgi:hypothetical protein
MDTMLGIGWDSSCMPQISYLSLAFQGPGGAMVKRDGDHRHWSIGRVDHDADTIAPKRLEASIHSKL